MVYYVALPFVRVDGGLTPGEAAECPHAAAAIRRAEAMSANEINAGAVAFSLATGKSRTRRVRGGGHPQSFWGSAGRFSVCYLRGD